MKCKYYDDCPSSSGWCTNNQPTERCVAHVEIAINNLRKKLKDAETMHEQIKNLARNIVSYEHGAWQCGECGYALSVDVDWLPREVKICPYCGKYLLWP